MLCVIRADTRTREQERDNNNNNNNNRDRVNRLIYIESIIMVNGMKRCKL